MYMYAEQSIHHYVVTVYINIYLFWWKKDVIEE